MSGRAPLLTLFAISVILASVVNLGFIYYATTRPRAVISHTVEEAVRTKTPTVMPRPALPIEAALRKGDVAAVKQHMFWCMKERNCNLEKDLRVAVASDNPALTQVLVAAGADVNAADNHHETPLHSAAEQGGVKVAKVLLEAGAEVDIRDDQGHTPLHSAASWGHVELARVLLAAGADVNAADARRQTPLHLVADRRIPPLAAYANVARMLLDAGARPNVRAADGSTPLQLAKRSAARLNLDGNMKAAADANEVITLLRSHGAVD